MSSWQVRKFSRKSKTRGQVALEYILTTLIMAMVASLLYLIYQPISMNVFFPVHKKMDGERVLEPDYGLGTMQMSYLPIP